MKKWHLKIVRKVKQEKLSKWSSLFEAEKSNTEKGRWIHKNIAVIKYLLQ